MMRLDKLWRAVGGPGTPPQVDGRRVRMRVNAALDAGGTERKIFMKKRLCVILAAAAALAIMGTAFAAVVDWDALTAHFKGDVSPGLDYLDNQVRTASDENYTLTVESAAADRDTVYLVLSVTARSDAAKAFLVSDDFDSIDTFDAWAATSGGTKKMLSSMGYRDLDTKTADCRRYAMDARFFERLSASDTVTVRCGYMDKGSQVEVPVIPAPSVTVKIGASGTGVETFTYRPAGSPDQLTIKDITLSPFTCQMRVNRPMDVEPRIFLRMKDGSIRTQAQFLDDTLGDLGEYSKQCAEVLDLESIRSVIVFDMEYPLDGSAPTPVEHDPALDPFHVTRMEPLSKGSGYSLPVRELTEKLGGTFRQSDAGDEATCTYRDTEIVLQAGSRTALVSGQFVELREAPAMQDGVLAAPYSVFEDAWGIDACVQREKGERINDHEIELIWHDWYIIP